MDAPTTNHLGETMDGLLDGGLSAAEEASARAHLADCGACAKEYARLSGAVAALHGLGRARAPEGFAARVLKRVRGQRRAGLRRPSLEQKVPWEGGIIVILVAAAAAVLVGYTIHAHGGLFAKADGAKAPASGRP